MDLGDCLLALTANCVLSASDAADHGPDSHARIHPRPPKSASNRPTPAKSLSTWIDLIPAGIFKGRDGRGPYRNEHPAQVIAATRALAMTAGLPIDFDHAIDFGAPQGQAAPAAGWIRELRTVGGVIQGRVEWTEAGARALAAKLYRYISPVFEFSGDGTVQRLLRAAVTNNPNLYLTAIAAADSRLTGDEDCRRVINQLGTWVTAPMPASLRAARNSLARVIARAAGPFLSTAEIALCAQQDVDPARFALARRERAAGRPLVMAPRTAKHPAAPDAPDSQNFDAAGRIKKAMDEIALFLRDPDRLESLGHLVDADAWLTQALEQAGARPAPRSSFSAHATTQDPLTRTRQFRLSSPLGSGPSPSGVQTVVAHRTKRARQTRSLAP